MCLVTQATHMSGERSRPATSDRNHMLSWKYLAIEIGARNNRARDGNSRPSCHHSVIDSIVERSISDSR